MSEHVAGSLVALATVGGCSTRILWSRTNSRGFSQITICEIYEINGQEDSVAFLVLLRHGKSQWNLENRFPGWVDVPLTTDVIHTP